jgi:hypothetical protein
MPKIKNWSRDKKFEKSKKGFWKRWKNDETYGVVDFYKLGSKSHTEGIWYEVDIRTGRGDSDLASETFDDKDRAREYATNWMRNNPNA